MKAVYTLLFALLLLVGCGESKEKDPQPDQNIEQKLNGAWASSLVIIRHLDESGSIVAELWIPDETGIVHYYDNGISISTHPDYDKPIGEYKYRIVERDGRHYIQYPTHEDEIVELTEEKLVWQRPYNDLYYHNKAGERKIADRALEIHEYISQ